MRRKRRAKAAAATQPKPGGVWLGATPPLGLPNTHAILSQVLARVFTEIDLSASLVDGLTWYPIHAVPNVAEFEMAQGLENHRVSYNEQQLDRARSERKPALAEYGGFHDLFALVGGDDSSWALVTGPFLLERPTSNDIHARWRQITGEHGHASDPEFLRYVSMTLSTTTFDTESYARFNRVIACFALLLGARGDSNALSSEVSSLREVLAEVRFVERMWSAVREMLDERSSGGWPSPGRLRALSAMGAERLPQHVMVGLLVGREQSADPVDDLLRRDAFLRGCVEMTRKRGGVLCGRIGDHGVSFVIDNSFSGPRLQSQLAELGARAAQLAKHFGLRLHLGVGAARSGSLPARYQSALAAAGQALSRSESMVHAEKGLRPSRRPLATLRKQLTDAVQEAPKLLSPRFDRYFEVLLVHCAHRLEPMRAHMESTFDLILEAVRATDAGEGKNLMELETRFERSIGQAATVRDLGAACRAGIADLEVTLQSPEAARHERSMRRAMEFVRDHLAEPLSVARVAKVAGFAPRYFAKLFAANERTTFHQYVLGQRLEQAKRNLVWTTFSVERVAELAGFPTRSHFHRTFVESERMTPLEYRNRPPKHGPRRTQRQESRARVKSKRRS